jgi:hypothetical protein
VSTAAYLLLELISIGFQKEQDQMQEKLGHFSVLQGDVCFFNDELGKNTANHGVHQKR